VDALVLHVVVASHRLADIVERIRHAGAARILHPDAHAGDGALAVFHDLAHPLGGRVGEGHDLEGHRSDSIVNCRYNRPTTSSAQPALPPTSGSGPMAD